MLTVEDDLAQVVVRATVLDAAVRVDVDRERLGDTDSVRELDQDTVGEVGGDERLGLSGNKRRVSGGFGRKQAGARHVQCNARRKRRSGQPLEEGEEIGGEVSKDSSENLGGDG